MYELKGIKTNVKKTLFNDYLKLHNTHTLFPIPYKRKGSKLSMEASYSFMVQRFKSMLNDFMNKKYKIKFIISLYENISVEEFRKFSWYYGSIMQSLHVFKSGHYNHEVTNIAYGNILNFFEKIKPLYISGDLYIDFITN